MIQKILLSAVCALFISGCGILVPPVEKPVVQLNTIQTDNIDLFEWWKKFNDPVLNELIQNVIENNHDIKTLQYAVDVANKESSIIANYIYPTIDTSLNKTKQNNGEKFIDEYATGLSILNYEIDYLGEKKLALDGSQSLFEISKNNLELEKSTIVFSTVSEYFSLKSNMKILNFLEQKRQISQKLINVHQNRVLIGLETEENLIREKISLNSIESEIFNKNIEIIKNKENLMILAGDTNLTFDFNSKTEIYHNFFFDNVPSSALESRYDIKNAEQELIVKNANIGLAKAAFFPKISLTTTIGSQSNSLGGLFSSGSSTWLVKPELSLNVFNGFNDLAAYEKRKIEYESSLNNYVKTVKNAFLSVQYNLSALEKTHQFKQQQLESLNQERQFSQIIENKVKIGQLNPKEYYLEQLSLLNRSISYEQSVSNENKILFLTMKSFFG